jgi:hypothetical protein
MDAVFGTTKYGYPVLTLVVRDEFGHANPVAMCITSQENSNVWAEFLNEALHTAGLDPCSCTFMIDKSSTEISAINKIGGRYILCIFHMLQDAERFLKSTESNISGPRNKAVRVAILLRLATLARIKDAAVFQEKSKDFVKWLEESNKLLNMDKVKKWYLASWEDCAAHWAGELTPRHFDNYICN